MSNSDLVQVVNDLQAQIDSLQAELALKVDKTDIINQINTSDESVQIEGIKLHVSPDSTIDDAVIDNAEISNVDVKKISGDINKLINKQT